MAAEPPTFARDVAPVLYARCTPCHQPDGDAPFSLITYEEVRRHARQIAVVTASRSMPPWKPAADSPAYVGDRRLSDREIAMMQEWVDAGVPEGRPDDRPSPPPANSGWLWGEPDLVLTLPAYTLRADGADVFRNFVVPVPGRSVRYVRALQFRPRSRAVHHANIRIDTTPASRALDAADPEPGYEGVILHSADYPEGHFLGWTPGQAPPPSDALAWPLPGDSDLVIQLHLRPTGRVESVAPVIGLYFTAAPPSLPPTIVRLGRQNLDIAAGAADYQVGDRFRLPVAAEVVAVQPHAHYRAREVRAWATLPDGSQRVLLHINDWDFAWQDHYRLAEPVRLPAGSELSMSYSFDNSARNPRNPSHPPERVSWGWRTSDEMADVWIQLRTQSDADRGAIEEAARRKMLEEDAVGSEVLIARDPNYVSLRNDAALIYRALGRADRALVHFAAVTRLEPASPAAHYNEAVTLEMLGRDAEAVTHYRDALRLDPSYAPAHRALGNRAYRSGQLTDAIAEYRAAAAADPTMVDARCNLARALNESGRPTDAVAEFRAALELAPDANACLINFAWLLSAHADDAVRRPAEAVVVAERAAALTHRTDADALDALGAAYASAGRFDDAIAAASESIHVLERSGSSAVNAVRARVELYRQHRPFVVSAR